MIFSTLTILSVVLYAAFLWWCLYHWKKLTVKSVNTTSNVSVAVIIPMRNEESNVTALLDAVSKQRYPGFEIIVVDDNSSDNTFSHLQKWIVAHPAVKVKCIQSTGQSKKDALALGITATVAELIITTDADCRMTENWISTIVSHYENSRSLLISSPVIMRTGDGFINKIQSAEYAGLTAVGAAAMSAGVPMYCSGANLAFSRTGFLESGGYEGSKSSSGDDTQLMRKISEGWPGRISFLKDINAATITTAPGDHLQLLEQRRRWASKIPFTLSTFTVSIATLAWLTHFFLLIWLFVSISTGNYNLLLVVLVIKLSAELFLLYSAMNFMKQKFPLLLLIFAQPFYALYIVVIGVIAPFTKFSWKGRRVN